MKVPIEIESIKGDKIEFSLGDFHIEIGFSTMAWEYTNRLRVRKVFEEEVSFWMHYSLLQEILPKLFDEKERERLWIAMKIGSSLSWSRGKYFLRKYLENDWEGMLKSAYYSLISTRNEYYYGEGYAERKYQTILKAVYEGLERGYFKRNKWVEKLENVKEYLRWRKILRGK